jgi:hypothetical protein
MAPGAPTFNCKIELNKDKGVTITVVNTTGQITQTVVMDGTSMILTCKGATDTSVVTQKTDSIDIKCKTFTLTAETVTVKSTKDSVYKSDEKMTVQSTKDLLFKSDAAVTGTAGTDFKASGKTFAAKGDQTAEMAGASATVKADNAAALQGATVEVSGKTSADVKSLAVKVAATGTLDLEGKMSTLKGQMCNVTGNLIKLG